MIFLIIEIDCPLCLIDIKIMVISCTVSANTVPKIIQKNAGQLYWTDNIAFINGL